MSQASDDVVAERRRQIEVEGWTPEHDDEHIGRELAKAAGGYLDVYAWGKSIAMDGAVPAGWPWQAKWWKPRTARRDLVRAGALIIAEIERLDRAGDGQPRRRLGMITGSDLAHQRSPCRACGASMAWLTTPRGKKIPVDVGTVTDIDTIFDRARHTSHFETCPEAARFSRERRR